ncbi:hypothetical protein [Herbidospora cretacea]|uniref:hypothetical protein n=1 Tax=Herbidospora cretacea TaxID=28444 RepID=UPI0004C2BD92|nr:hypothetical protein [Herbidospora cretacea]
MASKTGSRSVARGVTEVFAPAHLVLGLPLAVGAIAGGWEGLGWGAVVSALCGGIPFGVIVAGVRSGRFGDRHISDRAQRPWFIGVTVVVVSGTLVLLTIVGAPLVSIACVAVMLATLAVTGSITLRWKISFHTAVAAGSVVVVAWLLPPVPVYVVGTAFVGAIAWSRVTLGDHTAAQAAAGVAAGGAAATLVLAALL